MHEGLRRTCVVAVTILLASTGAGLAHSAAAPAGWTPVQRVDDALHRWVSASAVTRAGTSVLVIGSSDAIKRRTAVRRSESDRWSASTPLDGTSVYAGPVNALHTYGEDGALLFTGRYPDSGRLAAFRLKQQGPRHDPDTVANGPPRWRELSDLQFPADVNPYLAATAVNDHGELAVGWIRGDGHSFSGATSVAGRRWHGLPILALPEDTTALRPLLQMRDDGTITAVVTAGSIDQRRWLAYSLRSGAWELDDTIRSDTGYESSGAIMGSSPAGGIALGWLEGDSRFFASVRGADETEFSAPHALTDSSLDVQSVNRLEVLDSGDVLALWREEEEGAFEAPAGARFDTETSTWSSAVQLTRYYATQPEAHRDGTVVIARGRYGSETTSVVVCAELANCQLFDAPPVFGDRDRETTTAAGPGGMAVLTISREKCGGSDCDTHQVRATALLQ